jgi:hypothetical protein
MLVVLLAAPGRGKAQSAESPSYVASWSGRWHLHLADNSNVPVARTLLMGGIERRVPFAAGRFGVVSWAPSVVVSNTTNNLALASRSCAANSYPYSTVIYQVHGQCFAAQPYSAFGVGIVPLGFRWQIAPGQRVGLVAALDGGGVLFNHPLPVTSNAYLQGESFNFLARGGVDALVRVVARTWVGVGFRHVHLSNAGLGSVNPGIDADLLTLSVAFR